MQTAWSGAAVQAAGVCQLPAWARSAWQPEAEHLPADGKRVHGVFYPHLLGQPVPV